METGVEFIMHVVLIGSGATFVTDVWAIFLNRGFKIPLPNWGMVGRWFGHFPQGRFKHENIAVATPVRGERTIGWVAHYAIGITFAALLLSITGISWASDPSLLPALMLGVATVVAPFFILQPGLGFGIAAAKMPNPAIMRLRSLASHTVFGIGLYLSAVFLSFFKGDIIIMTDTMF